MFYLEQRKRTKARAAFERLAAAGPSNSRKRDALWQLGRMNYRDQDFEAARASFRRLASNNNSGYHRPATYWEARSLERLGQAKEAGDLYADLTSSCPGYYYGIEAESRLAQMRLDTPPDGAPVSAGRVNFKVPPSWGGQRYLRVRILDQVGFHDLALDEMERLLDGSPPGARLEFARLAQRAGRFRRGADEIEDYFGELVRARAPGLPRLFWEAAYPLPHWQEIQQVAREYGQDPFVIAAIIREESRFDEAALSRAGARGLMQLMPSTARDEARRLGIPSRDLDLFDPATSIRLGTYSFSRRLDRFKGNVVLALAGYNAGDYRANRWAKKLDGLERDEFIDLIPYRETRLYIKRILASYDQYRWIYGSETAYQRM
jgi:soluble lytic murein transglycosylase